MRSNTGKSHFLLKASLLVIGCALGFAIGTVVTNKKHEKNLGGQAVAPTYKPAGGSTAQSSQEAFRVYGKVTTEGELKKNNAAVFYELEKQIHGKIGQMAREAYLKSFWDKRAAAEKTTSEKAMKDYITKNVKVDQKEVVATMERVKDHPSFKTLTEAQKKEQVTDYLKSQASRGLMERVLASAERSGDLVISYPAPKEPRFPIALTKDDHVRYGPKTTDTKSVGCEGNNCPIVIIEYSEFQCPYCSRVLPSTKKVLSEGKLKGKIVFSVRDFPLSFHKRATPAAVAAKCSAVQGKYWEMYHKLFENQKKLEDSDFESYAKAIGLDMDKYKACYKSPKKHEALIHKNFLSGQKFGVTGTPAFFINGRRLSGAIPYEEFMRVIDDELKAGKKKVASK